MASSEEPVEAASSNPLPELKPDPHSKMGGEMSVSLPGPQVQHLRCRGGTQPVLGGGAHSGCRSPTLGSHYQISQLGCKPSDSPSSAARSRIHTSVDCVDCVTTIH